MNRLRKFYNYNSVILTNIYIMYSYIKFYVILNDKRPKCKY